MNKDVEIRCRVSEAEKSLIKKKAKANKMKLSEYVRFASIGTETIEIETEIKVTVK